MGNFHRDGGRDKRVRGCAAMDEVRVLTVSRESGSGGGELARRIGRALGWRVVDREVVRAISRELRLPEEEAEARDERVSGLAERVGVLLSNVIPDMVPPSMPPSRVDDEEVRALCESVLREAVRTPPVILVGHGASHLFRDRLDALHVRVVAPDGERAGRLARRDGISPERALEEVRARDGARRRYIRHHYGTDWAHPLGYHVVLNTGALTLGEAEALVVSWIRDRPE